MRHAVIRILLGMLLCLVGIIVLVRGQMDWYYAALFIIVGLVYLYSAYSMTRKK